MNKIRYCKDCKYWWKDIYLSIPLDKFGKRKECYIPVGKNHRGEKIYKIGYIEEKNKNYDCSEFKRKIYKLWIKK